MVTIKDKKPALSLLAYCPTLKEIDNPKIVDLAKILQGSSDKETLSNVLEWEDINLRFWMERWYIAVPFILLLVIAVFVPLFDVTYHLQFQTQTLLWWPIAASTAGFVSILAILLGILITYYKISYKELPRWLFNMLLNQELSVDNILKYRLVICRDYARFTACLLLNLYPNNEIFFVRSAGHVATGIKINNKTYILDQTLPIDTLEKWTNIHNGKTTELKSLKLVNQESDRHLILEECNPVSFQDNYLEVDTTELTKQMVNLLGITSSLLGTKTVIRPLYGWAKSYEKDEVVEYSFACGIQKKLYNESISNLNKITKIEIKYENIQKGNLELFITFV